MVYSNRIVAALVYIILTVPGSWINKMIFNSVRELFDSLVE